MRLRDNTMNVVIEHYLWMLKNNEAFNLIKKRSLSIGRRGKGRSSEPLPPKNIRISQDKY